MRAKAADQRQTVEFRQHSIDNQHVIGAVLGHGITLKAVARDIGRVPGFRERFGEVARSFRVVLDHQDAHAERSSSPRSRDR